MRADKKNILLTGATGFIGSRLLRFLSRRAEYSITCALREERTFPINCKKVITDIGKYSDWSTVIEKGQIVVHTAARAHMIKEYSADPLSEFRKVNVEGTLNLARQAAENGAKRFVFLSSIGVNGNTNSRPFTEYDEANPKSAYAQSKWEAENALWEIQRKSGMEVVIIRPPLVYGPNAPGNFRAMTKWVRRGVPLPLGAIHNKRSLIALDNLVDFIFTCVEHPAAANQVFLIADDDCVSTSELLRKVSLAMERSDRLFSVPSSLIKAFAKIIGKEGMAQQLLGSLQVDNSKAKRTLDWEPPLKLEEGLRRCFKAREKH